MSDRTLARTFGEIFRRLAEQPPTQARKAFAATIFDMACRSDFLLSEMQADEALLELGREVLSKEEAEAILYVIGEEGFDYAFRNYSSFGKIHNDRFHELRLAYIKATDELEKYIEDSASDQ